jgi:hypothetical protein
MTPEQQAMDFNPELQDVSRQRKLADLLMAQGLQGQPQGQMISGYYVAPSFTQQLNPLANALAGQAVGERADVKQAEMAAALRGKYAQDVQTYAELQKTDPAKAIQFGLTSQNPTLKALVAEDLKTQKYGEGEIGTRRNIATGEMETVGKGGEKYHAPISIDTGNSTILLDPITKQKIGEFAKAHQPVAGQVVETATGPMLVNTRTGQATPVMGAGGQAIAPKLSAEQSKDITSINQQMATIDGALKVVKEVPNAFSFKRGTAQDLPGGETIAGRFDKPEEAAARAYVFNNVSAVIKERAGTAQSAQELQRINSFMPGPKDNAQQIENKFNGFKTYLKDLEKGTRVNPNVPMQPEMPKAPIGNQTPQIDPKLLQFMTPEQRKLFGG